VKVRKEALSTHTPHRRSGSHGRWDNSPNHRGRADVLPALLFVHGHRPLKPRGACGIELLRPCVADCAAGAAGAASAAQTRASELPDLVKFARTASMEKWPRAALHAGTLAASRAALQRGKVPGTDALPAHAEATPVRHERGGPLAECECSPNSLAEWECRGQRAAGVCVSAGHRLGDWLMCLFGRQHLYHEESKVVWNGNSIKGRQNVERFLTDLPASKHEPCSLDCQPVKPQGSSLRSFCHQRGAARAHNVQILCAACCSNFLPGWFGFQAFVRNVAMRPNTKP